MNKAHAYLNMIGSEGWQLFNREIRSKIDYHRARLMDCKSWDELQQHRGSVEVLESLLVHVGQTIREEIDENESSN